VAVALVLLVLEPAVSIALQQVALLAMVETDRRSRLMAQPMPVVVAAAISTPLAYLALAELVEVEMESDGHQAFRLEMVVPILVEVVEVDSTLAVMVEAVL
jgi:hypothetical protein